MMLTAGTLMFYAGIGGIGLSVISGIIIYGSIQKSKSKLKKKLEETYKE